jgi:hypothetical protein
MAATRLGDVIVPEVWNPYVIERTAALSAVFQSGIAQNVEELNRFAFAGGNTIQMPFFQDLSGDSEVLTATGTPLTVNPITSEKDIAVVLARGKAWGANELAAALAGADPMRAIGDLVAAYWARDLQKTLVSILQGVFAAASMSTNKLDISAVSGAGAVIGGDAILDAAQKLGDAKSRLTAILMHSATENRLAKSNLIDYLPDSEGRPGLPTYMGKRVIVDDSLPVTTGVYKTYLFGPGAIGYHDGTANSAVTQTETDRDSLAGEDILINRKHFVMHPRGVKYGGAATDGGPTNATLATGTNWVRVYEAKNVRVVELTHRVAPV